MKQLTLKQQCALDAMGVNFKQFIVYNLLANKKLEREFDISPREIITKMKRYGTEISPRHVGRVMSRLEEKGFITIVRKMDSWYKVIVYPLNSVLFPGSTEKTDEPIEEKSENDCPTKDTDQKDELSTLDQQQHIILCNKLLRTGGFSFTKKTLKNLAKYSIEQITKSIDLCLVRCSTGNVGNKEGLLIQILRGGWYRNFDPDKAAKSLADRYLDLKEWFIDNYGKLPDSPKEERRRIIEENKRRTELSEKSFCQEIRGRKEQFNNYRYSNHFHIV